LAPEELVEGAGEQLDFGFVGTCALIESLSPIEWGGEVGFAFESDFHAPKNGSLNSWIARVGQSLRKEFERF
jgi:hypothetical protein